MRIGTIEILCAVFQSPDFPDKVHYVIGDLPEGMSHTLGIQQPHEAEAVNVQSEETHFYLCHVQGKPDKAIVRADDAQEALNRFVDNCQWAQAEQNPDAFYNGNGTPFTYETIRVKKAKCILIIPDPQ